MNTAHAVFLRRSLVAGLVLVPSLVLSACAGNNGNDDTSDGASATPSAGDIVEGGTLRFAVSSDTGCVDPQQIGSNDSIYSSRQLADSLTDQDPDTGEIVPWLAQDWEISEDASEFTFTLQEGVTFSNGEPVDSAAVAANLDAAKELGARAGLISGYLLGYESTEVLDDRRFTVHFEGPSAQFLQATSTHAMAILAPETTELTEDERCREVIGSGPFVLEEYAQGDSISLTAREDYAWGSSLWDNQKRPHIDGIEFSVVPESGVRAGSLQSGQTDVIGNIANQDQPVLESANAHLLHRNNPGIVFALHVNHEHPFLAEKEVREAISSALNREEIVDTVYTEFTPVATSILSSTTPGYVDLSEQLTYDPERTRELLEQAGFQEGAAGWERDGELLELEIVYWDNSSANSPAMELVQQQLAQAGIGVDLREAPIGEASAIQAEGDYDLAWGNTTRADPDILRSRFDTSLSNNQRIAASDTDEVLAAQAAESDIEARNELIAEAQKIIVEQYQSIPVLELTTVLAARETVHGIRFDSGSRVHLNDVWIEDVTP